MRVVWAERSRSDLARLHEYLHEVAPEAADLMLLRLSQAPDRLLDFPRMGSRLDDYKMREIRRIIVGNYELRYEIAGDVIFVLRVWHCREDRAFGPDDSE